MLSDAVTRDEIVSYFMAMLELLKLGRLHARQEHVFDDILILPGRRDEDGDGEPAGEQPGEPLQTAGGADKPGLTSAWASSGDSVCDGQRGGKERNLPSDEPHGGGAGGDAQRAGGRYDYDRRGLRALRFGRHVQLATRPDYAKYVEKLLQPVQKQSLSQAVMETLAVIAYRQPVTKAEIELIRGVKCDYSVQMLVSRGLIEEVGRKGSARPTDSIRRRTHFAPLLPDLAGRSAGNRLSALAEKIRRRQRRSRRAKRRRPTRWTSWRRTSRRKRAELLRRVAQTADKTLFSPEGENSPP